MIMKAVITIFLHVIASTFQLQCSYATYFIKIWVVPSFDSCSVCLTTNMNFDYWFYVISRQLPTFNDSNTNLKKKYNSNICINTFPILSINLVTTISCTKKVSQCLKLLAAMDRQTFQT